MGVKVSVTGKATRRNQHFGLLEKEIIQIREREGREVRERGKAEREDEVKGRDE